MRVPELSVQQELVEKLARVADTVRATVKRVEREISLLQEFRTRLVADVVTGQVDVRAIAATLPDAPECEDRDLDDPIHTVESDSREEELVDG